MKKEGSICVVQGEYVGQRTNFGSGIWGGVKMKLTRTPTPYQIALANLCVLLRLQKRREYTKYYLRERYAALKETGICVVCGKNNAEKGHVRCWECSLDNAQRYGKTLERKDRDNRTRSEKRRLLYEERKALGICVRCGKKSALKEYTLCQDCMEKRRSARSAGTSHKRRIAAMWQEMKRNMTREKCL